MYFILSNIFVIVLVYFGVEFVRLWSLKRKILAIPNERSLHSHSIPHGAGLVIALTCLIYYSVYSHFYFQNFKPAYLGGAILIASISWFDDLYSVRAIWRLVFQSVAAISVIFGIGFFTEILFPFGLLKFNNIVGIILTFLWIVGLTNAFNFMDGIDGLAGLQGILAGVGWFITGLIAGTTEVTFLGLLIASSCFGFLLQNWQPAKIFMGDVGSSFLGFSFAVLPIMVGNSGKISISLMPLIGSILVWIFLFDTLFTILGRIKSGQIVWEAHRQHIYQKLVVNGYSHQFVTVLYGILTLFVSVFLLLFLYFENNVYISVFGIMFIEAIFLIIFLNKTKP